MTEGAAMTKGEQTKHRIAMTAKGLFGEKGYLGVTMKDICQQTGLSRGGLYAHLYAMYTEVERV